MIRLVSFLVIVFFSLHCSAHSRWIVPSHTVISGSEAVAVSFDLSISNDIFHPDNPYGGLPLSVIQNKKPKTNNSEPLHPLVKIAKSTRLQVALPDGSVVDDSPIVNLGRKSASGFMLEQNGTYRFDVTQDPIFFTSFKTKDGGHGRLFGKLESVRSQLPKDAKDVKQVELINRVQTYVSHNAPSQKNIAPQKRGLEFKFGTHPNDLFANEPLAVKLLMNGKPLADADIKVTRSGTRFRNDRNVLVVKTDKKGDGSVAWPEAGLYLLEVEVEIPNKKISEQLAMHTLYVTLEVFPE